MGRDQAADPHAAHEGFEHGCIGSITGAHLDLAQGQRLRGPPAAQAGEKPLDTNGRAGHGARSTQSGFATPRAWNSRFARTNSLTHSTVAAFDGSLQVADGR